MFHDASPAVGGGTSSANERCMTMDHDDVAVRDDLAPAERLRAIADILAEGVRRWRDDRRRVGVAPESPTDGLELSEPASPDGTRG
ncbi:MAG: hypothetical protein EA378_00030 [Phycisphaerales bacterium]|nr:MAG: hypothetical protein EA378_00030 [Phycisphaerales bacterium]